MLNPTPVGDAIAAFVKSSAPSGGPITDAQLRALWEGIMAIIYDDLKANLGVMPGSFEVNVPPGGGLIPVTGTGGPAQ